MWDLLNQWKQLTDAEREAILAEDWELLQRNQIAKQQLQSTLSDLMDSDSQAIDSTGFQSEWGQLIDAEQGNSDLLEKKMRENRKELGSVDRKTMQLGQIRHAYSGSDQNYWNSYS
ncbi:MAG: hypothetical protein HOI66_08650 [Verrucomicrobia bacterium]|jgi:hypothetical protein|nr:hypothetical protein [Verrucomicrobiota bacterium]MDA7510504.1 hypothetical protein [Verrucomicrobiota bacterium]